MNVYILGDVRGAYRVEQFVKKSVGNKDFHIYVNDLSPRNMRNKISKRIAALFALLVSDIVYVAPCRHTSALLKIAVLFKKKIITDFYISFYDTEVLDRKNCKIGSAEAKRWRNADRYALKHSNIVLFLNESEARYYSKLLDCQLSDISYFLIPLCIPQKPRAMLPYFSNQKTYIHFCWCGTYVPLQALDKIINAFSMALRSGIRMQLTIWGDNEVKAKPYIEQVNKLKIAQYVTFVNDKWGRIDEWVDFISKNCDVTLGIFGESKKANTVLANKVMDGVAFRTPVLTAYSLGALEFFSEKNIFFVKNCEEDIANMMVNISKMCLKDIKNMTESAYMIYARTFTPEVFWEKISVCMKNLFKDRND